MMEQSSESRGERRMKKAVVSLIVLAAGVVSTTALGAASAPSPSMLVLQRSDLPAGATRTTVRGLVPVSPERPAGGRRQRRVRLLDREGCEDVARAGATPERRCDVH